MIYEKVFSSLSEEQALCAGMCESLIAYGFIVDGETAQRYLASYRESLGASEVCRIYETLAGYICRNCKIVTAGYDSEGGRYTSIQEVAR